MEKDNIVRLAADAKERDRLLKLGFSEVKVRASAGKRSGGNAKKND